MTSRGRIRTFVEWEMGEERRERERENGRASTQTCREIESNVCFSDLQKHFSNIRRAKLAQRYFSPLRAADIYSSRTITWDNIMVKMYDESVFTLLLPHGGQLYGRASLAIPLVDIVVVESSRTAKGSGKI